MSGYLKLKGKIEINMLQLKIKIKVVLKRDFFKNYAKNETFIAMMPKKIILHYSLNRYDRSFKKFQFKTAIFLNNLFIYLFKFRVYISSDLNASFFNFLLLIIE